ncbi:MAG: DUF424 family protein [Candidatus Nanoarchaeia archaeon]|nr:DUF424 family protein [Candidatus Nanoarchaeia archaeon]
MIVKKHVAEGGRLILCVCDEDIIGKNFQTDDFKLDLSSDFYKGDKKTEHETIKLIEAAYMINLVGDKSVELGLKLRVISKQDIIKIDNIPYVQAVSMES